MGERAKLDLQVAGYAVDQVSLYVPDVSSAIMAYTQQGYGEWVRDQVWAKETFPPHVGRHFVVDLAFNYQVLPCEFELISLLAGQSIQLPETITTPGFSHMGFHVDRLTDAVARFADKGFPTMRIVETIHHTGTPRRYTYAFMDTRSLGFISKLIVRREG